MLDRETGKQAIAEKEVINSKTIYWDILLYVVWSAFRYADICGCPVTFTTTHRYVKTIALYYLLSSSPSIPRSCHLWEMHGDVQFLALIWLALPRARETWYSLTRMTMHALCTTTIYYSARQQLVIVKKHHVENRANRQLNS
jgi:hypothetical protein